MLTKKDKIPFCQPYINPEENKAVLEVMRSKWLTTGQVCEKLENQFAKYVGSKYAVAVSSGTAALKLSIKYFAHHLKDLVIACPSFTFAATACEIINTGHQVKFMDVRKDNYCMDETLDYTGVDIAIPVHLTGNKAFTNYKCPVVEDSAHRLVKNQCLDMPINHTACFSFYPTKPITTGEGGMIATNDAKAYKWLKMARNHGINRGDDKRYQMPFGWRYSVNFCGEKANLSDVQAAIGVSQLRKLPWMDESRWKSISLYNKLLEYNNKGLHLYPIFVRERDKFINYLAQNGIATSVHFQPLHKMPAFKNHYRLKLPVTEWLSEHIVSLPLYPGLLPCEIECICDKIKRTKLLIKYQDICLE